MTDLVATLRDIASPHPFPVVVECAVCLAPVLSGTSVTTAVERVTACAACALEESAAIAVKALTLDEPEQDLLTLQRASEVLSTCAGMAAAAVGAMAKRAKGGQP